MKFKLKEICTLTKGDTGIMKAIPGKYPLVALSDERRSHNAFQFEAKAVIVPLISSTGHGHASLKRVHYQEGKFALGNILCAVIPKDEAQLNAKYLHLYLQLFKDTLLVPLMRGMANVSLPMNKIADVEIHVPSLEQQAEIIALEGIVGELKADLEKKFLNQKMDVLKLRQAFLREAMQGRLLKQEKNDGNARDLLEKIKAEKVRGNKKEKSDPPINAKEIPFDIPENWVWCRLNQVCIEIVDCPHSTPKYLDYKTGYYAIDTTCINDSGEIVKLRNLSKEGFKERVRRLTPNENDIVYAREGSIGLAAFIPRDTNICLGQRVMLLRPSSGINHLFLKMIMTEESYKNRLLEKHRGMGAKHVNVKDIVASVVPLPPLSEQNRLVKKLEQFMYQCDELQASIQASQYQNEKLLQQVLREALHEEEVETA
jgi:type I restriction enzyme S subunit